MRAGRFRQIRNLFDAALERDPSTRNAFLKEACLGDQELLLEVGKLLAAHGQPTAWIDDSILGEPLPRLEGRRIGAYEILRQLGEGGMGTVYLAATEEAGERQVVALKIVRPEAATEHVLRRFKREREILEALDHPNIARVLGGGTTDDGLPYLAMDFVDGRTIDVYCDGHNLDIAARMKLFRDVCAAVQYAHEHHVVHRDLKPSNILVTPEGVVKLLDFGIARMVGSGPDSPTRLTRSDMLMMTPEYASPEQISGASVTPASDVYALGVVLYELLTGRRPYHLKSRVFHEIARIICEEPPDRPSTAAGKNAETTDAEIAPTELRKSLSGNIDAILLKALEKDPSHRYASARALSDDIRHHVEGKAVIARRHALIRTAARFAVRHGWWITGIVVATLAVYSGKVPIPPRVLFAVISITAVVVVMYHVGKWDRGRDHARTKLTNVAKALPFLAIAMTVEGWILLRLPEQRSAGSLGIELLMAIMLLVGSIYVLVQWRSRDRLGPVVLELNSRWRRNIAWAWLVFVVLAKIIDNTPWFEMSLLHVFLVPGLLMTVVRDEVRQRGLLFLGFQFPWTRVASYSWEAGRGRHEGKEDVLKLRIRAFGKSEFLIPVEHRNRMENLLEQQLAEWPASPFA